LGDIKWLSIVRGPADSAIVEEDELIGRCKPVDKQRIPVRTCSGETIQDYQRPAIPNPTTTNLHSIELELFERLIGHRRR
jgi:hypothetical protein